MKSKRLVALSVFGEEEEDDDVVLTSLFQKLIYFRSHSAAIGCNCTTVQIVFSEVCAVNPSSIFFSSTFLFSSSEIGSFFVRRPPASAQPKKILSNVHIGRDTFAVHIRRDTDCQRQRPWTDGGLAPPAVRGR